MNRDALVIGINRYPWFKKTPTDEAKHLKLPAQDAEAIAQLLETQGNFKVTRLPESWIDGRFQVDPQQLVTVAELETAIKKLFQPEGDRIPDTALLFFAGHGLQNQRVGEITQGYLASSDASPKKSIWGVSLQWLRQILNKSPIKQQIIFLDCCHSGELFNFSFDDLQIAASDKMRFFVTASREFESAYSSPSGKHGAFTEMLLKGLNPTGVAEGVVTSMNLKLFMEQELIQVPQKPLVSEGSREILLTSTPEKKHLLDLSNASRKTSNWICRNTLTGHGDRVTSVAISPDGKIIASGSLDRTIKLWDLATGKLLENITQHSGAVTCITFSRNGETLASSSARPDGSIKLWNINTGQLTGTLRTDNWIVLNVWSIALSPDGKTLVSGHHADSTVKIWDVTNQRLLHTLKGHGWAVNSVAFSPDGQIVASGGADSNIKLWNVSTGREIRNFNGVSDAPVGLVQSFFGNNVSDNQVCTVAFSPDGKTLASGGENQFIKLWGVNNKNVNFLKGSSEKVHTVAFSPDGKTLASGGADGIIRIWNLLTGKVTFNLGDSSCVYSLAFSPDGKTLVSGNGDNTIQVWNLV